VDGAHQQAEDLQGGQHVPASALHGDKSGVQLKRSVHGGLHRLEGGIQVGQQLVLHRSRAALHPRSGLVAVLGIPARQPLVLGGHALGLGTKVIHRRSGASQGPCDLVWLCLPLISIAPTAHARARHARLLLPGQQSPQPGHV
jgi:hypothetical protein